MFISASFLWYFFKAMLFLSICLQASFGQQELEQDTIVRVEDTNLEYLSVKAEPIVKSRRDTKNNFNNNKNNKNEQKNNLNENSSPPPLRRHTKNTNRTHNSQHHPDSLNNSRKSYSSQHHHHHKHDDEFLVTTETGDVRGGAFLTEHLSTGSKKVRVDGWLGIPYAEPPVGTLRFKRPVPIKKWKGVLNATTMPNTCYQTRDTVIMNFDGVEMWNPNTNVSEDCLYLNIWTPYPRPKNAAVMVWIYGGGFYSGTMTLKVYDPKVIVAETQVIFVAMNYRVSLLGFLYLNHPDAPGNQGLIDQLLALKWIHNNIQYFGGDTSRITLFGESAGSVSVSLHLLSRQSRALFTNAILESGTALADWSTAKNAEAISRSTGILESVGCKVDHANISATVECAQQLDITHAFPAGDDWFYTKANQGVAQFVYLPVVDNYFIEEEPVYTVNRAKHKMCPILIGANKDEGSWFFVYSFEQYRNLTAAPQMDYENFKLFLSSLFHFYPQYPSTSTSTITNAIIYRYTNWNNIQNSEKNIANLDDAAGDFHFLCPVVDFANSYALNQQDVFFYYFTHRSSQHSWPPWLGVMHADEIPFVFGEPLLLTHNYSEAEKVLTRKILKYWSNFAKYSNPNGPVDAETDATATNNQSDANSKKIPAYNINDNYYNGNQHQSPTLMQHIEPWPKYKIYKNVDEDKQRAYMKFDSVDYGIDYNLRAEYCTFWGLFLPNLVLSESSCNCGACNGIDSSGISRNHIFKSVLPLSSCLRSPLGLLRFLISLNEGVLLLTLVLGILLINRQAFV